jgi:parallel beta-helix repeat protein/predicted outer membrane repeat protein
MKRSILLIIIVSAAMSFNAFAQEVGPTADFSASPISGERPLTVQFEDRSDPGTQPITSWEWDFDDNATIDSTEQNPSYTYTVAGTYTVSLTVTTSVGSDTATYTNLIFVGVYYHIYVDAVSGDNPTGDGSPGNPYKTITYAIASEELAGTPDPWYIHVLPGTYDADPIKPPIDREMFPIELHDDMILSGTSAALCIIDGSHVTASAVPLIEGIDTEHITIENLTLQNMDRQTGNGGALHLENPSGAIQDCVISGNYAYYGGGGYIQNTLAWYPFDFLRNTIEDNSAIYGHGVYVDGALVGDLTENTVSSNPGTGIRITGGLTGEVTGNAFTGNSGRGLYISSGGLRGDVAGNDVISNSYGGFYVIFVSNSSGGSGGGFLMNGALTGSVTANTFINNSASSYGGGFYASHTVSGDVTGNTFSANTAGSRGGGLYAGAGIDGSVQGCVFSDNMCTCVQAATVAPYISVAATPSWSSTRCSSRTRPSARATMPSPTWTATSRITCS